ncbi:BLUF domain-containing protein [Altibacter sp. HG106]|uniref:BLUF domain-containing protein n=1 Tax=Altibacter sp. HG106 TaxID=3023937 RepID=UPI002350F8C0|nr:BLUF domain-containing protein [Altibacter sp. HG106]MDC7994493.1 BLUF domain-containing protein [Altibacter sp. HG106]
MSYTICYVSKAQEHCTEEDIQNIFDETQQHNLANNIHGILLYGFGNFFQVLEGNKEIVERLFQKICEDERHQRVEVLIRHYITIPIFATYSSKFNIVKTNRELEAVRTYLDTHKESNPFSDKVHRLIHPFIIP